MQRRLGLDLEVPDDFGHFLAGFSAGEACFYAGISSGRTDSYRRLEMRYSIHLRLDDRPALEYIRDMLGVGRIHTGPARRKTRKGANPEAKYEVRRIGDLYHVIVPLFEKYPIRPQFKKARDFEIWKQIIDMHYHEGGTKCLGRSPTGRYLGTIALPQSYWDKIQPLVEELKAMRGFDE